MPDLADLAKRRIDADRVRRVLLNTIRCRVVWWDRASKRVRGEIAPRSKRSFAASGLPIDEGGFAPSGWCSGEACRRMGVSECRCPDPSLHRSQILRDLSDAGCSSGILRLRRKIPLL